MRSPGYRRCVVATAAAVLVLGGAIEIEGHAFRQGLAGDLVIEVGGGDPFGQGPVPDEAGHGHHRLSVGADDIRHVHQPGELNVACVP